MKTLTIFNVSCKEEHYNLFPLKKIWNSLKIQKKYKYISLLELFSCMLGAIALRSGGETVYLVFYRYALFIGRESTWKPPGTLRSHYQYSKFVVCYDVVKKGPSKFRSRAKFGRPVQGEPRRTWTPGLEKPDPAPPGKYRESELWIFLFQGWRKMAAKWWQEEKWRRKGITK